MQQEAPRRAGQSQPCRPLARLEAALESDGAAAEGRSQPQLRPGLDLIITNAALKKKAPIHDSTAHEKLRITLMDANNSGHPTFNLSQARTHELNSLSQDR